MNLPAMILTGLMGAVTFGSFWGAQHGYGLAEPTHETLSVREGSERSGSTGRYPHSRRYIYGGGIHRGK